MCIYAHMLLFCIDSIASWSYWASKLVQPPEVLLENRTVLDNQHYPIEDAVQVTLDMNKAEVWHCPQRPHHPPDLLRYDCHSLEEHCNYEQGRKCSSQQTWSRDFTYIYVYIYLLYAQRCSNALCTFAHDVLSCNTWVFPACVCHIFFLEVSVLCDMWTDLRKGVTSRKNWFSTWVAYVIVWFLSFTTHFIWSR